MKYDYNNPEQPQYHERKRNPTSSEKIDARIYRIESETDFDVLNFDNFSIDIMDRTGSDGETVTINIYGKTTNEIIEEIKLL